MYYLSFSKILFNLIKYFIKEKKKVRGKEDRRQIAIP